MSTTSGSSSPALPATGRTAAAPEWRIISSSPVEPSGKRTVSRFRWTIRPLYTGRDSTQPGSCAPSTVSASELMRFSLRCKMAPADAAAQP